MFPANSYQILQYRFTGYEKTSIYSKQNPVKFVEHFFFLSNKIFPATSQKIS